MSTAHDRPKRTTARSRGTHVQSLEKGLAVLGVFTAARPLMTIADIAEQIGQDVASVRRSLLTLAELGHVRQQGKRFALTARVLDVAYQYLASLPVWAVAHPVMEELSGQLNETVSVGVLDARDVVFILRVPAKRFLTFDPSIGSRVPAHLHSIGHVLMAAMAPAELEAFVRGIDFSPRTTHSIAGPKPLTARVQTTRTQGWSLTARQYEPDHGGISVPLLDRTGRPMAALNVSFIVDSDAERRAAEDILPRLRLAARRIQEQLPPLP